MTFRSRLEFTAETMRQAFARSGGICECHRIPWLGRPSGCGVRLVAGGIFYEHLTPDAIRPDNSLDNCAVLSRTCWREKTARFDLPVIAKSNRTRSKHIGAVATPQQVIVGTIASGWKHKLRGGWERRPGSGHHPLDADSTEGREIAIAAAERDARASVASARGKRIKPDDPGRRVPPHGSGP